MATTDLNTSIQFLKDRVDATLAVQKQIAAEWVWPERTVAQWTTDSEQLDKSEPDSLAALALDAAAAADQARGKLDARMTLLHRDTLKAVGVMRVRAQRDAALAPVVDELSARGDSRRAIEDEGTALLSAWKTEFGPEFSPAPLLTFASFQKLIFGAPAVTPANPTPANPVVPALPSLRDLKQALSDAATIERKRGGALGVLLVRAERDVQDWYQEATSVYPAGAVNGDLVRTIPTTTAYNPPTPAEPPKPA